MSKLPWGSDIRVKTDDCDKSDLELSIFQGGNGDWYISILPEGHRIGPCVRISTSGGASARVPGLTAAIAEVYQALYDAQKP
jgi:hypothetical protein